MIVYKEKQEDVIMIIPFDDFFDRLKQATGIDTQMALSEALGINRSAVTQAKNRDAVPQKWVLRLARRYTISADWLEFGTGPIHPVTQSASPKKAPLPYGELVDVPKVAATVSAGGGSYENEAFPIGSHPFPRQWLSKMGNPSTMVFMDVVGNSMEPSINDGDMVLIDQSGTSLSPHGIFAVGFEDTLYIKRVEQRSGYIILHSDNPDYSDMEIGGDELDSFRVIGKVIWLCRDCRF